MDIPCQVSQAVKDALASGVRFGVQGLVDAVVQSMAWLLGQLAKLVFSTTSMAPPDAPFYAVYNQLAGVMVVLVLVFFLVSAIINGLRVNGPGPLSTLGGLVRAIFGITFAGGIAWTITAGWDEATGALIDANSGAQWDPGAWVKAITALSGGAGTAFVALFIAGLAVVGLVLLFIMLLFRSLLVVGAALFGAMAMTGQVMPETRSWGRRWFWTVNALASSKFFIAALWIYGSRAAYGSDHLMTSLQALLMIWIMVVAPAVLLRLTTLWDGYLSDVNAPRVLAAAGHAVGTGALTDAFGGGGGGGAPGLMNANLADLATTPAQELGEAGGLTAGPGREAAEAAETAEDGGRVGQPPQSPGSEETAGGDEQTEAAHDDTGRPNADEAEATGSGVDAARADLERGQVTPPGATAAAAPAGTADPGTPESGGGSGVEGTSDGGVPGGAGAGAGAGAGDGQASSAAAATGAGADGAGTPDSGAVPDGDGDPGGSGAADTSSGTGATATTQPSASELAGEPATEQAPGPDRGGSAGGGEGAGGSGAAGETATGGGSGGAAAAAGDAAIVAL